VAVDFDGTDDEYSRAAMSGVSDGKLGTFASWVRLDGDTGAVQYIFTNTNSRFNVQRTAANTILVQGKNSSNTSILLLTSNTAYTASTSWIHIAASWDLGNAAGNLYINGADDLAAGATITDDSIDYTRDEWHVAASWVESNYFDGAIEEIYFDTRYLDITSSDNLIKLYGRDSTTIPQVQNFQVGYGPDAIIPTGSQPTVYLSGGPGGFGLNGGYGGDFSIVSAPTFDRGPQFPLKTSRWLAKEGWKECAYCGWWFPRSQVVRDRKGLWACLTGPTDYDPEDRDDAVSKLRF
jgi:hypothetical protein